MSKKKVLVVIGTRPEAIKMGPIVQQMAASGKLDARLCVTAQHRHMLDQVLEHFCLTADHDLDLMQVNQSLEHLTARILTSVSGVIDEEKPDLVMVHGDTATTMAASLAAFYKRVPVGHVEAGLRSGIILSPWPEEMNRRFTSMVTQFHFAPTEGARQNLLREGVPSERILVSGNTVIDALLWTSKRLSASPERMERARSRFHFIRRDVPLILVTGHRRENFGPGFLAICAALREIAEKQDVEFVYPVHPNPNVRGPVEAALGGLPNIHLIEPQEYEPFVYLMEQSRIMITDSGGIQEEAPSLGKPILVMREVTERPEAVDAGAVLLVGTSKAKIVAETLRLLTDEEHYKTMSLARNPYGDGHAAERIVGLLEECV